MKAWLSLFGAMLCGIGWGETVSSSSAQFAFTAAAGAAASGASSAITFTAAGDNLGSGDSSAFTFYAAKAVVASGTSSSFAYLIGSDDPDPISPADLNDPTKPVDIEDPEAIADPAIKFSAYDYVGVYDGVAHTIKTNELIAAYRVAIGEDAEVTYGSNAGGGFVETALPELTDVGATCVWYKVTSANYADIIHAAKVVITNRPVTITSASDSWTYDGQSHSNVTVTAVGLVEGETITTNVTGTITEVGTADNAFTYTFVAPAKESNYDVHCVTGTLTVAAKSSKVTVTVTGHAFTNAYTGAEQKVSGFEVSISDPLYTISDFSYSGASNAVGTVVGKHEMGLKKTDFMNLNNNFSEVEFVVTDGELVITKTDDHSFVPGEQIVIDTELIGYTVKDLPSGLKYNKKTGVITGAATKPTAEGGATVTFTKKGAEMETITIVVGPIPTVAVDLVGDTDKCKVTGAGKAYLVGKKVSLSASAPKGTAFVGWIANGKLKMENGEFEDGELVSNSSKLSFAMGKDDVSLTAKFEKEKMSVACAGLATGDFCVGVAGGASGIPLEISTQSGIKSVKATKLPTGMKLVKDKATGEWSITGSPTKAGTYNVVLTVTAVSGATESVTIPVMVEALPAWVCGTFGGMLGKHTGTGGDDFRPYGVITMKITTNGKITAKITAGGKSYSFSGTGFESVDENEDYYFKMATKKGEVYEGVIAKGYHDVATMVNGGFGDEPDGAFTMTDGRSYWAGVWRNEHGKDGRLSADASGKAKKVMDAIKALKSTDLSEIDSNYGTVKVTIDTKGNVKFAGKTSDGFKVSGSTFLMLDDDGYHVIADMPFYDKKSGNVYSIRPCWQPIFNQQGDIVDWDEECCDHSLKIYPFE